MNIQDIQKLYGVLPQGDALMKTMEEKSVRTVFLQGLLASATPMFFASIVKRWQKTMFFVLNDNDEAGYFYNDLKTIAILKLFFTNSFCLLFFRFNSNLNIASINMKLVFF